MTSQPPANRLLADESGMALAFSMIFLLVVSAMVAGALAVHGSAVLVNRTLERQSRLERSAADGLEAARTALNGDPELYPDSGWVTLEDGVDVEDAEGEPIPGVERWIWAGPSGITSGQYGVFGTVVSLVRDAGGGVAIRRAQLYQESFARFAYFTDVEPSNIYFGGGDQIFGPVHTNDVLKVHSTGATFHDDVRTAEDVEGAWYGDFRKGYQEGVQEIPLPETADLEKLRAQAQAGSTYFEADPGAGGLPTLRLDFKAIDLDDDGSVTGEDEGFVRAYRSSNTAWLLARVPAGGMASSRNCGHYHADDVFYAAAAHPNEDNVTASLTNATRRCYLGGSDSIFGGFVADDLAGPGEWLEWPGAVHERIEDEPDAGYLFPLTRPINPDFKGVIFVDGDVAVSGVVRSRVTIAATGDIYLADDLVYANDPGAGSCADIVGLFAGNSVIVADNTINSPVQPGPGNNWVAYDDTKDEYFHAIVLALNQFTVQSFGNGATRTDDCEATQWGRGCLYLTGGIIQRTRGAVGQLQSNGGTGYLKRYSYDACGASAPPPYFPTTGHFFRGALYEVDPVGFDVAAFFDMISG